MSKAKYVIFILTLSFCSTASVAFGRPSLKQCISPITISYVKNKPPYGINEQWEEINRSSELLDFIKSTIRRMCSSLIKNESSNHPNYSKNCFVVDDATHDKYAPLREERWIDGTELSKECMAELTPQDVIASNSDLSLKYQTLLDSEEKQAAGKKLAQQMERNFDIKGLNLKLNKQQIISIGGQKVWRCSKATDDPAIEVCTLEPTGQGCIATSVIDPLTGGTKLDRRGQIVMSEKCGTVPIKGMPPEVMKMATLGGKYVTSINVGFFNGKLFSYQILIEGISPELKSGLKEKYGNPTVNNTNLMQWFGKDETLELLLKPAGIGLYRDSLTEFAKEHKAAKINADQNEAQEKAQKKEKAISEQKKRDI